MRKWRKDLIRELQRSAIKPCAALVFPRKQSGCGNNEDLCTACNAREELRSFAWECDSRVPPKRARKAWH